MMRRLPTINNDVKITDKLFVFFVLIIFIACGIKLVEAITEQNIEMMNTSCFESWTTSMTFISFLQSNAIKINVTTETAAKTREANKMLLKCCLTYSPLVFLFRKQ